MVKITHQYDPSMIVYEDDAATTKETVENAVKSGANLDGAYLIGANLDGANLTGAYLIGANLTGANLDGANLPAFSHCPEIGSFAAFKKLQKGWIAVLEIPAEAKRTSSLIGRKCRAEFAKVIRIESVDGAEQFDSGISQHDHQFVYQVGEIVRPDRYCDDIRTECSSGIHFFITRKEAVDY